MDSNIRRVNAFKSSTQSIDSEIKKNLVMLLVQIGEMLQVNMLKDRIPGLIKKELGKLKIPIPQNNDETKKNEFSNHILEIMNIDDEDIENKINAFRSYLLKENKDVDKEIAAYINTTPQQGGKTSKKKKTAKKSKKGKKSKSKKVKKSKTKKSKSKKNKKTKKRRRRR